MLLEDLQDKDPGSAELLCRSEGYADDAGLLRDLLAMANVAQPGARWILVGVENDAAGGWRVPGLPPEALRDLQQALRRVADLVEPACEITPVIVEHDGRRYAAIEIDACDEPPYVARRQLAPDLRTGACWVRDGDAIRPARRQDLEEIYANRRPARPFRLGLGADAACELLTLDVPDTGRPPSAVARRQLRRAIEARRSMQALLEGGDTGMARLAHARIFGADVPYVPRGMDTLVEQYNHIPDEYRDADEYYYREEAALKLNFSLRAAQSGGLETVRVDFSLPLVTGFRVVEQLALAPDSERSVIERQLIAYPKISCSAGAATFHVELPWLAPGEQLELLETPLRIMVGDEMRGRKVAIRYRLSASNLSQAVAGRLKLAFRR